MCVRARAVRECWSCVHLALDGAHRVTLAAGQMLRHGRVSSRCVSHHATPHVAPRFHPSLHPQAFPCTGCKNCGSHTDEYFNPKRSSTNKVLSCGECRGGSRCSSGRCEFSQSYTEGSSWKAVQMQDVLWVGDDDPQTEPAASLGKALATPFTFGCQFSETGLFRTQKADGIMGMSSNDLTLIPKVPFPHVTRTHYDRNPTKSSIAAYCASIPCDPLQHTNRSAPTSLSTTRPSPCAS